MAEESGLDINWDHVCMLMISAVIGGAAPMIAIPFGLVMTLLVAVLMRSIPR